MLSQEANVSSRKVNLSNSQVGLDQYDDRLEVWVKLPHDFRWSYKVNLTTGSILSADFREETNLERVVQITDYAVSALKTTEAHKDRFANLPLTYKQFKYGWEAFRDFIAPHPGLSDERKRFLRHTFLFTKGTWSDHRIEKIRLTDNKKSLVVFYKEMKSLRNEGSGLIFFPVGS